MQVIDITGRCLRARSFASVWLVLALAVGVAAVPEFAAAQDAQQQGNPAIFQSVAFLAGHPDVRWRLHGLREQERGNHERAFRAFQRAARHADKPSQAAVAEMLWQGTGVRRDRALAYAWMDLAAERGQQTFLAWREQYWQELDEAGRERAVDVGQAVYAEYGDEVAKPRQERVMRRARRDVTGSRTGMAGSMLVVPIESGVGQTSMEASRVYDPRYWDPEQYWQWQDQTWEQMQQGTVNVRPLQPLED